jgi:hypothetical protein
MRRRRLRIYRNVKPKKVTSVSGRIVPRNRGISLLHQQQLGGSDPTKTKTPAKAKSAVRQILVRVSRLSRSSTSNSSRLNSDLQKAWSVWQAGVTKISTAGRLDGLDMVPRRQTCRAMVCRLPG